MINVGVLGATGAVGQRFVQLLADHPWFNLQTLTASERSAGKPYGKVVNWRLDAPYPDNHRALQANLLAQTEAFANGQGSDDPARAYAGGRPSTMILLDALTPQAFGALLALYEHSVYLQSVIWGINAFDQFGVELGKQVASRLLPALAGDAQADDPVTRELLAQLR